MSETPFTLRHDDAGTELVVTASGTDVATYVYRPDAPLTESPKPYLYPLKTLSGAPLGVYRPWDHRWHKGLQMTWSHLEGDNFWGGPTYTHGAPGHGYVWRENHGRQEHRGFAAETTGQTEATLVQGLDWIASDGAKILDETRTLRFHGADLVAGVWALDFATSLTNVHGKTLGMGSPTTHGREGAGYTGLFWRGPRSWTGGDIFAGNGLDGEPVMGTEADWAAVTSDHDDIDGGATVLAFAGSSDGAEPLKWFARSSSFACLNPSPAFDTELALEPGATLTLSHRFVFIDEKLDRAGLEPHVEKFAL
ncbi:DUF6807 domain-containing protein [Streptomyces zhihengii]